MSLSLTPPFLLLVVAVLLVAGAINGLAGFGFAVLATMVLASVVDPAVAVVFVIVPILAVNLSLVRELSAPQLRTCGQRFAPLLAAALVGAVGGMAVLDALPTGPLRIGLGVLTLAFVASAQRAVTVPGLDRAREGCFVESTAGMAGFGAAAGLLFGGTNVGVQFVAYVRSCDLSHGLFVGVLALLFLGLNAVRVGAAAAFGLYPDPAVLGLSVLSALPAVAGVAVGTRLRATVSERQRRVVVLGLLTTIGVRLLLGGLGIV